GSEITIYVSIGEEPDYKYYVSYDFGANKPSGAVSYKFTLEFVQDGSVTKTRTGNTFDVMTFASRTEFENAKISITWIYEDGSTDTISGKTLTVQKVVLEEGEEVPKDIFYTPSSSGDSTENTETEDTEVGGDSSTEDTSTEDTSTENNSEEENYTEDTQN
ncbi:MAG: hypothetical protein J6R94_01815, partial [Agathobacter sp.]|nr:hypothetical protein [Agathobacter sp.]